MHAGSRGDLGRGDVGLLCGDTPLLDGERRDVADREHILEAS